jgi:hypothetical protein
LNRADAFVATAALPECANPGSAGGRRDPAVSSVKIGDVAETAGDWDGAIARYGQSRPIA